MVQQWPLTLSGPPGTLRDQLAVLLLPGSRRYKRRSYNPAVIFCIPGGQHRCAELCWDGPNSRQVSPSPSFLPPEGSDSSGLKSLGSPNRTARAQLKSVAPVGVPVGTRFTSMVPRTEWLRNPSQVETLLFYSHF